MQESVREKILRELDALGEHVKGGHVTHDEVELYLGLLKEARNFMAPEEVARIRQALSSFQVQQ